MSFLCWKITSYKKSEAGSPIVLRTRNKETLASDAYSPEKMPVNPHRNRSRSKNISLCGFIERTATRKRRRLESSIDRSMVGLIGDQIKTSYFLFFIYLDK